MSNKYQPTKAFIDGDPLVYAAAFSAQQTRYYFIEDADAEREKIISPIFSNAKEAESWRVGEELFEFEMEGVETVRATKEQRRSILEIGEAREALKRYDEILKLYLELAGNSIHSYQVVFTAKGTKFRDHDELPWKYQGNRKTEKPFHYDAVREYALLQTRVREIGKGLEADDYLVSVGEKYGDEAVVLSIDKDIGQMEKGWFIHVSTTYTGVPYHCNEMGFITREGSIIRGGGALFLCFQILHGDDADGFYGLRKSHKWTKIKAYNWVKDRQLCNPFQLWDDFYSLLHEELGDHYTYTTHLGVDTTMVWSDYLNMIADLAYMQRTPGVGFNIYTRIIPF